MNICECEGWKRNYSSRPTWEYCPYCGGAIHKPEPKQPDCFESFRIEMARIAKEMTEFIESLPPEAE